MKHRDEEHHRSDGWVPLLVALAMLTLGGTIASATPLAITCQQADVMVAKWKGPLSLTYAGEASGPLTIKAPFGEMTLPARMETKTLDMGGTQKEVTRILAVGTTSTTMPDLAALEACIANKIEPGKEGDNDSYLNARDSCLETTPPGAAPISIHAEVFVIRESREDPEPGITIKRTYLEKTKAPGGTTTIESFPTNCGLARQ